MNMIRFTPYAWAKLLFMRDKGPTEVAGYGISSLDDPLLVTDFQLVKQIAGPAHFEFDDEGLADFSERMAFEHELQPAEYQRILIHTHPGNSATPSGTDETNFEDKMSDCSWAIMFILARGGETTCALKYKNPALRVELGCMIDFSEEFDASDQEAWEEEYKEMVEEKKYVPISTYYRKGRFTPINRNRSPLPMKTRNPRHANYMFAEDGGYGWEDDIEEDYDFDNVCSEKDEYTAEELEALEMDDLEQEMEDVAAELGCTVEELKEFGIDIEDDKQVTDLKNGVR